LVPETTRPHPEPLPIVSHLSVSFRRILASSRVLKK
jgi:hypothetical protein